MAKPKPSPEGVSEEDFRRALREIERRKKFRRIEFFKPYPKQQEFCNATIDHSEVVLQAGNQQGKTEIGSYAAAVFATGLYPDWWQGRRWDRPTSGWACGESSVAVRDVSQRKLCGPPGDEAMFGTGMIPRELIVGRILGHGAGGAFDLVKVKHVSGGISEIGFKSYDQDRGKWQGTTLDWVWCDEEPPVDHYMEALARLVATAGLAYSTFTPLNGNNLILPRFSERTPEAMRDRIVIRMRLVDAGHLADEERRKALIATFPEHQRRARIDGLPMLGSGAVFEDVELSALVEPLRVVGNDIVHATIGRLDTGHWAFLWGIDFGISHPFAAVLLAHDRDKDAVYVISEVRIKGGTPAIHASRMKALAAGVRVAWPHDGSQRDKGSGEALAAIYKREGLEMLPQHATFSTGGFSTEAGIMEMLTRMRSGRFKVAAGCIDWQDEFMGYHRKDGLIVKTNDDLLSATRVGIMQLRSAQQGLLRSSLRGDPSGVKIAEGADTNLWGIG